MNRKSRLVIPGLCVAVAMMVLAACNGGGTSLAVVGGGTGGTGVSMGTISGFGSVIVNGVHYDATGATITVNGNPATESDLSVGMVVKVTGTTNSATTGTASQIDYNNDLEGPVTSKDASASSFVVLGQTVVVGPNTVFGGTLTLATLASGNVVEVSGYRDSSGTVHATRVELIATSLLPGGTVTVAGEVSGLDTVNHTFTIGSLTVSYAGAQVTGVLDNGVTVAVKITHYITSGPLPADSVAVQPSGLDAQDGEDAEIEGIITSYASAASFVVNGQAVSTNSGTSFVNGTAADLAVNKQVEVEGAVNASGVLVAATVEFEQATNIRAEGDVTAVDSAAGTVTVLGLTFHVSTSTVVEDESSAQLRYFSLSDVGVGDHLDLRGYQSGAELVASQMVRTDPSSEYAISGPVTNIAAPNMVIEHVTVETTDGSTQYTYVDPVTNAPVTTTSARSFFGVLTTGTVVQATGTLVSGSPSYVINANTAQVGKVGDGEIGD